MYSEKVKLPVDLLKQSMNDFQPKEPFRAMSSRISTARSAMPSASIPRQAADQGAVDGIVQIPPRKK